ncbi:hypothetical protein BLOT_001177 [Blomia tropicalis]|nr:hypothetical protein BLOT_001177 [Blomia tropicalis]
MKLYSTSVPLNRGHQRCNQFVYLMGNQKPLETTGSHGSGDGGGVVDLDFMYFEYSIQSYGGVYGISGLMGYG